MRENLGCLLTVALFAAAIAALLIDGFFGWILVDQAINGSQ